jgi:hypothetical protein
MMPSFDASQKYLPGYPNASTALKPLAVTSSSFV